MPTWFALLLSLVIFVGSKSERLSFAPELEKLVDTSAAIIETLNYYLKVEERRLREIARARDAFDRMYKGASKDPRELLENPVSTYLLIKKLTNDWPAVQELIHGGSETNALEATRQHLEGHSFPTHNDLVGAATALIRLQEIYSMETSTVARGIVHGNNETQRLTADDCYVLGRQAYDIGDHANAFQWLAESKKLLDEEDVATVERTHVLDYYVYVAYKRGNYQLALELAKELNQIAPDHPRAASYVSYIEKLLESSKATGDTKEIPLTYTVHMDNYQRLCRGEKLMPASQEKDLFCHYVTNSHPNLLLQPAKREHLCLRPEIVIFHDVLTDKELEEMINIGKDKLTRSMVADSEKGSLEMTYVRHSYSAFLVDEDHDILVDLNRRIEVLTGLKVNYAENHQVAAYGVGGHYMPHYDYGIGEASLNGINETFAGNRIATWLNYLSDVKSGGATVFPEIGVTVWPKKGSAAFWYNMFRNGKVDERTLHSGCPVLSGSKWIGNKWIHEREQLFRRPCTLSSEE